MRELTRVPLLARYGFGAVYSGPNANIYGVDPPILNNPAFWSNWFATNSANRTNRWAFMQIAGQKQGNTYGAARWQLPHLAPFLAHWRSVGPSFAAAGIVGIDYGGTRKALVGGQYVVSQTSMETGPENTSVAIQGENDVIAYAANLLPWLSCFGSRAQWWADAMPDSYAGAALANPPTPQNDTLDLLELVLQRNGAASYPVGNEAIPRRYTGAPLETPGAAQAIQSIVRRRPFLHIHGNSHDPLQNDIFDPQETEVHVLVDGRANPLVAGQAGWWMIDEAQTVAALNRYVDQGQLVGIGGDVPPFVWAWWDTYARSLYNAWRVARSRARFFF